MYEWVEHAGEVELAIEADSEAGVFVDAMSALGELLGDEVEGEPAYKEVAVSASDHPALLAEWLSELVFLAETEGFVPERVAGLSVAGEVLRATVEGRRGAPPHLVKAVTYHGLSLALDGNVWKASVVFDV